MKIFILGGAGTLGSSAAFHLGRLGLAGEIVLCDINEKLLTHQLLDLQQSVCMDGGVSFCAGTPSDMEGSDIVLVCASPSLDPTDAMSGAGRIPGFVSETAGMLKNYAPEALVINLANPLDAINYLLWRESGLERRQFIGFSLNDAIRLSMAVGEHLGVAPRRVEAYSLGEHGASKVAVLSRVLVDGEAVGFTEPDRAEILKIRDGWWKNFLAQEIKRTAGWSSAVYAGRYIEAAAGKRTGPLCCSCVLDGEYGLYGVSLGVPALIGPDGVQQIVELPLDAGERSALGASAKAVRGIIAAVGG